MREKPPVLIAAEAHTDLTVFGIVAGILEGGHLYRSKSQAAAEQITRICQREQQRLLREYDNAVAATKGGEQ
jgi:hypothetical protein